MKRLFPLFALALGCAAHAMAADTVPLWLRDVKISPDGSTVAFTYKGDIYTVPVSGGHATRVTTLPSYEASPVWSPDSRSLAFASDRNGNMDIYIVDATGGQARRLTLNSANETPEAFTPDGRSVVFSASIQDPVTSAMFPSGRMTELYAVDIDGKSKPRQLLGTPAQMVSYGAPDGSWFLYQDVKGFEDEWRKHHTSGVTRDIIRYDAATGRHTNLTDRPGEDRNPVVAGDSFYFLSERDGGTMNVYRAPLADPSKAEAVTHFTTHPVRFLSRGADGTLCFAYDGEIYTLAPDAKNPVRLAVTVTTDADASPTRKLQVRSGARGARVSPDGKQVAFIYRGNVFVTPVDYSTTRQITFTPEAESDISWGADSKSLIYTSERDGRYNIYRATMRRPDHEASLATATVIDEEPIFKADKHERTAPDLSPDGKKLTFILDRNKLMVMDMESKKVRQLTDGSTYRQRNGRFNFVWSPDSRFIALEMIDRRHDPYTDIAIIDVADGKLTNLTNSAYFDESPVWSADGNAILFASERYGMRNHASWGSQSDVMAVFLNRAAFDRFNLTEEERANLKDMGKEPEKNDSTVFEPRGIADRTVRLTPNSSGLVDMAMTADGENVYYITSDSKGQQLYKLSLVKPDFKLVSRLDGGSFRFDADKARKNLFLLGSSMKKLDPKSDKLTAITYGTTMELDPAAEREFMFDNMAREESERFYTASLHGVDWPKMTAAYRRFLPHIDNNYDFAELLSELLGELNVSHTGGRYSGGGAGAPDYRPTASLGLLYDLDYTGKGLKVAEVVEKGPFDKADIDLAPGSIIEKINGTYIDKDTDIAALLADAAGRNTLVSVADAATGKSRDVVVKPVSAGRLNSLLYDRWVKQRAADVDRWSDGRLGYVHISSMNDDSFRRVYSDLLGKYNDREGVVVDIRWNGGGRLHEDIEVLLSGKKYFTQEIRGEATCDMPSRRWNKPSVMVMSEACYSNAHGTPWVYRNRGIGKLVGMPVAGTMTSVNWVTMQDPTMVFGIPVIGYRLPDGSFLENTELQPDIRVVNDPDVIVKGTDQQLKAAVESLLHDIDAAKAK